MGPSSDERHEATARDFLEARARRDYNAAVALLTCDALWVSPVEGPRRGRVMIREMLVAAERDTHVFKSRVECVEARGNRTVATIVNTGEREDEELHSRQWLVFGFAGDKIDEITIEVDDPTAVARFWQA